MIRYLAPLLLLFSLFSNVVAQKHTVSGYVTDAETGEKLIGARVFDPALKAGALTNAYGFYSITVAADTLRLSCSYLGYTNTATAFLLNRDTTVNMKLQPEGISVEAVEITAEEDISESSQMSSINVPIETIKKIPSLMGEVDVIKALQLLPGVQSGSEGGTGLYVRGGGPDQNLILLDGVPVYNVSHLFGFFSLFPANAINNVNLIKGGFPARYGGRLSSVIDMSLKEGNSKEFHGEGGIGLLSANLTLEGPIVKDKTSFMISGRRTYFDILAAPFVAASSETDTRAGYYFYDLVGKVNHKFSDRDRLYLSFYGGRDKMYLRDAYQETVGNTTYNSETSFGLGWGNLIGAVRWNHVFSPRLFGNLTATFSDYDFSIDAEFLDETTVAGNTNTERFGLGYISGIRDWSAKLDFDFYANPRHLIRFGAYGTHHTFTPGVSNVAIQVGNFEVDTSFGATVTNAIEMGLYVEDDWKISERHKMNVGLHASGFAVNGSFYRALQPRFSHRFLLDENWALKGSFASMYQYVHLLTNSTVGLPTDLWVPTTDRIRPQLALQGALGVTRSFHDAGLEFSVEGYYKYMTGLIEYKEGAAFLAENADWEDKVEQGDGWSYGAEFLLQRKRGKLNGWVGYTLSWTNREFENLNGGRPFPYKFDRRHDISLVLTYNLNEKWDFGLTWVYGTGNATTLPIATFTGAGPSPLDQLGFNQPLDYIESRNGFRLRAYHRLDLGINRHIHHKRKTKDADGNITEGDTRWSETWSIGVYNAYSRRNPFFLYFDYNPATDTRDLKQVSLFPIIPSVAWKFKF
ncbi:MAG: TonB-dependent receptor plug domain-containing protein [Bacteroidota bacterium]